MSEPQELKALHANEYTRWGAHAARGIERELFEHEQYALSGACAGLLNGHMYGCAAWHTMHAVLVGGRELPLGSFHATSRLDLFDLDANRWLERYDIDGALARRIGHSVVTVGDCAVVFGGEHLDVYSRAESYSCLNDVHALSFANDVLRCRALGVPDAATADPLAAVPTERAWHASTCVTYSSADDRPKGDAVLILGGRDTSGALLADVWLLVLAQPPALDTNAVLPDAVRLAGDASAVAPRWIQPTITGASPLPLAYHSAVAIGNDSSRVLVVGGKQSAAPSAPMLTDVYVLDLAASTWSVLALSTPSPSRGLADHSDSVDALTARCCCTVLSLVLPVESHDDSVVIFCDAIAPEQAAETRAQLARDVVIIFGGFSQQHSVLPATTCVMLDVAHSTIRTLALTNAGLVSYMAHASVTTADRESLYMFGGIDPHTNALVDATTALHFWRPQPLVDDLDDVADNADANPITTLRYANGDVYVGETIAVVSPSQLSDTALRHGQGKCTYANGDEYDGQWADDQRCGHGTMVYICNSGGSGCVYVGQWERDQRHGYGIQRQRPTANESATQQRIEVTHDGHWRDDIKCGSGTTTFSDGSTLVATWQPDGSVTHGRIERFDDGNGVGSYSGALAADGTPDGDGTSEHTATGETYTGAWRNGRRCGHGVATLHDGSTYTGEWRNSKRNGFGTFIDARTRAVYKGKWVGGVRCGRGVCSYANGSTYDGEWQHDACDGHGRFTFASSAAAAAATAHADGITGAIGSDVGRMVYEGSWRANRFCGDGALVLNASDDGDTDDAASKHL